MREGGGASGGGGLELDKFFTKDPNLKQKKNFLRGGGGWGPGGGGG